MNPKSLREVLQEFKDNLDNNFAGDGKCLDRQEKYFDQAILDLERIIVPEEMVCPMHFGKYRPECKECIRTFSRNQAIDDMKARIKQ